MKITKEMTTAVINAMIELLESKGNMNKMVSPAEIEEKLMEVGCNIFIPVNLTLDGLIQVKYVRYFKLDSGKLMFGFTKKIKESKLNKLEVEV